ncbi:MAG: hypothetical protein V4510_06755 [bacterium]
MRPIEKSWWALAFALAAGAMLAGSVMAPWFSAEHSSGRRTPPNGLEPPQDTGVQRQTLDDGPGTTRGDIPVAEPAKHAEWLRDMSWLSLAAAVGLAIVFLAEVPGIQRVVPRFVSLAASGVATLALAGALAVTWFGLPASVGISSAPFTSELRGDGYWRTTLGAGFALAGGAIPLSIAAFLAKFQAGWDDTAAIEQVARKSKVAP